MAVMQVFLSHSSKDKAIAEQVVKALRGAGASVWFDEHNLGAAQLQKEIQRELVARPIFIVLLSPAAFASDWVRDECGWAWNIQKREAGHVILPVVISEIEPGAFNLMLFLEGFKRVAAGGHRPLPHDQMVAETLRLLSLTPAGQTPTTVAPASTESVDDLLTMGGALEAQQRWSEALPFFQRATEREPRNADAWGDLGRMLNRLRRYPEALPAHERSLALDDRQAWVWNNKGNALNGLNRNAEALIAYDRALAIEPNYGIAWNNKSKALNDMRRHAEALAACERAIGFDPNDAFAWNNKASALNGLGRYDEGLAAAEHAIALDPEEAAPWFNKGSALAGMRRHAEALFATQRGLVLDPNNAAAWYNKGLALENLGRYAEALVAYDRGFDRNDPLDWNAHARVYRALGRISEADAAERRAKELGG